MVPRAMSAAVQQEVVVSPPQSEFEDINRSLAAGVDENAGMPR